MSTTKDKWSPNEGNLRKQKEIPLYSLRVIALCAICVCGITGPFIFAQEERVTERGIRYPLILAGCFPPDELVSCGDCVSDQIVSKIL